MTVTTGRNKRNNVRLLLPKPTNFSFDNLTLVFLPVEKKYRPTWIHEAIMSLWVALHPEAMPLTLVEAVRTMAVEYGTTQSAIINAAIIFKSGKDGRV